MSWYKGSGGTFTITITDTFQQVVALVVGRGSRKVAAKFAYPARTGYTTLAKSGDDYSAAMTETETLAANAELHDVEVKMFIDDNERPVGKGELEILEISEAGKVEKDE
jgi:hypothetical protein